MTRIEEAAQQYESFVVTPEGIIRPIARKRGHKKLSLEQAQEAVNGYIEMVPCRLKPKSWRMFVNEEGRLRRMPPNRHASEFTLLPTILVGPVLFTRVC